ncbi:antitoxin Xre-like helix-turn-helix domain-containing protein [Kordia sp.]|uniref:antitoxin Xre-like helix-turn-helix domain-containing protein n=1 Tax=Kordia sp. TaxID=1965332 RepID=UPI003D2D5D07
MENATTHTKDQKSTTDFFKILDKIIQPTVDNFIPVPKIQTKNAQVGEQGIMYQNSTNTAKSVFMSARTIALDATKNKKQEHFQRRFLYSDIDTIASARNGIEFNDFKEVYDLLKLSNGKWAEIIGISERTMQSILKEKRNLDQNKSEKLLSFLTLIEYALDVLGNEKNVEEWLNYKSPALQSKAPIEYVDTFQGISMLREQLFKIDTGNFV